MGRRGDGNGSTNDLKWKIFTKLAKMQTATTITTINNADELCITWLSFVSSEAATPPFLMSYGAYELGKLHLRSGTGRGQAGACLGMD